MRSEPPALLPIFRSQHQAHLLAELLLHPDEELTLTELATRLNVALSTVHLEVGRLVEAGILSERAVGRSRLVRANRASRLNRPLTDLLMATYGPATVVAEEFSGLAGMRDLYIFGSWAARYAGEAGPSPNDVDVAVVGDKISRLEVDAAAQRAEQRLRLPVNPVVIAPSRWNGKSDPLSAQIRASRTYPVLAQGSAELAATT
jgi:DNA-binding transcriptional ArsR family regulator